MEACTLSPSLRSDQLFPRGCTGVGVCLSPALQAVQLCASGMGLFPAAMGDMGSSSSWCLQPGRNAAGERNWAQAVITSAIKNPPNKPRDSCVQWEPLHSSFSWTVKSSAAESQQDRGTPIPVPVLSQEVGLGHCAWCHPPAPASAHSPRAWLFPLAMGKLLTAMLWISCWSQELLWKAQKC